MDDNQVLYGNKMFELTDQPYSTSKCKIQILFGYKLYFVTIIDYTYYITYYILYLVYILTNIIINYSNNLTVKVN